MRGAGLAKTAVGPRGTSPAILPIASLGCRASGNDVSARACRYWLGFAFGSSAFSGAVPAPAPIRAAGEDRGFGMKGSPRWPCWARSLRVGPKSLAGCSATVSALWECFRRLSCQAPHLEASGAPRRSDSHPPAGGRPPKWSSAQPFGQPPAIWEMKQFRVRTTRVIGHIAAVRETGWLVFVRPAKHNSSGRGG